MSVLLALVLLLLGVPGCANSEGDSRLKSLNEKDVVGTWRSTGGGVADFLPIGTVELAGVTCEDVFIEGREEVEIEGEWDVRPRRAGGEPWIALEFSTGVCGAEGVSESGFYPYKDIGDLVIHLSDPGMTDKELDFYKD